MKYELDFTIQSTKERINLVNEIIEQNRSEIIDHFDNRFISSPKCGAPEDFKNPLTSLSDKDYTCHQLESMADYILYAEKKESKILTKNRRKTIKKHEGICLEEMIENDEDIIEDTRVFKKESITKEDLEKYPEIKKIHEEKENLKKSWKTVDIITSLNFSMITLKRSLSGQFHFRTHPSKPQYNFDTDTGYFKDDEYIVVSENTIDFNNPKHIFELINNYAGLVDQSYEDCQSDIKHFLYVLEDMIKKTSLPDYMFDILVWKVDGLTNPEIVNELKIKYGLVLSEPRVSIIYRDIIPQKICETYKNDYEDWLYTYKVRGSWKKCSACGEIKLATERNFYKDSKNRDGFRNICINCWNIS